ncbi:hypothetical protein JCM21900_001433 [Sporobolomyces salmonicolor]
MPSPSGHRAPGGLRMRPRAPTDDDDLSFLRSIYPARLFEPSPSPPRASLSTPPLVTLTYAQSLDGKIAGAGGIQIRLSGDDSMRLTHRLRAHHDSILVGVGTVLNDDPQLNVRIPHLLPQAQQPQPIILDSNLRTAATCKLITNFATKVGKQPILVCSESTLLATDGQARAASLSAAGARIEACRTDDDGHLSLTSLLASPALAEAFGRALMVEGGSSVITSFLGSRLVDLVVVTVAPVLVGAEGVSMARPGIELPHLEHVATKTFGKDTVFACKPSKPARGAAS